MAAKVVSARVEQLLAEAAELPAHELAVLADAIRNLKPRDEVGPGRHAIIAERIARVHAGSAETLSLDEVERGLRKDLDF